MSTLFVVRLGPPGSDKIAWARYESGALVQLRQGGDARGLAGDIASYEGEARVGAILPGERAAYRTMPSPPRQSGKLTSAAKLLLEDELALPIEDHHIAIHRYDNAAAIVAIEKRHIDETLERFAEAGVTLSVLTTDFFCLDGEEERGVLVVEGDRMIANFGERAYACELEIGKHALVECLVGHPDAKIGVYADQSAGRGWTENPRYERLGDSGDETLLRLAGAAIDAGRAVNFLQGAYRPPRKRIVELTQWRRAGAMAASLAFVLFVGVAADAWRAGAVADHYESEARRIFETAFPDVPENAMRSHARTVLGASGGASFLAISDTLGAALLENDNVVIDRIRFDQERGVFAFSVRSRTDGDIAAFRESLSRMGATTAETSGYRRSGDFWIGEMTVALS
ncbi:MAG: type II secretion system protein GspL [Pseudomonadota bacterium]